MPHRARRWSLFAAGLTLAMIAFAGDVSALAADRALPSILGYAAALTTVNGLTLAFHAGGT